LRFVRPAGALRAARSIRPAEPLRRTRLSASMPYSRATTRSISGSWLPERSIPMNRTSGFTAPLYSRGFTPTLQRQLPQGHLVRGLPTVHGRFALLSVRPFPVPGHVRLGPALGCVRRLRLRARLGPTLRSRLRLRRYSQVRLVTFSTQPPDLHRLGLGRESFAVMGPLALTGSAFYPIPVRRLADSLPASFSAPLAVGALRFASIATTNSPGDSHPRATSHAGHTHGRRHCPRGAAPPGLGRRRRR
jgi:hypothetical protein